MYLLRKNLTRIAKTPLKNLTGRPMMKTPVDEILQKHANQTSRDWNQIKSEILENNNYISPKTIDYTILANCVNDKFTKIGLEYAEIIQRNKTPLNMAIIGRLLNIYGKLNHETPEKQYEDKIIDLYEDLKSKSNLFDASINEAIIIGLSSTKMFRICFQILEDIKITNVPSEVAYSSLIVASFKNNLHEEAWSLMQEMVSHGRQPKDKCYLTYIQLSSAKIINLQKLFQFWCDNDIIISQEVADNLKIVLQNQMKPSEITKKNQCLACKNELVKLEITSEEFDSLKKALMHKVIVGKDIFRKSSPQELKTFQNFIDQKNRYDVIIDGLNVAYSQGQTNNPKINSMLVHSVVRHFKKLNKSVLVIGRTHMERWPNIMQLKSDATLFLTQNLSHDDPYLLYCALNSGKGSIIVSRDLMRSHLHLLKDIKLKQVFKRWLALSQYQLITVKRDGGVILKYPKSYLVCAQKSNGNVWHIPFYSSQKNERGKFPDVSWICAKI